MDGRTKTKSDSKRAKLQQQKMGSCGGSCACWLLCVSMCIGMQVCISVHENVSVGKCQCVFVRVYYGVLLCMTACQCMFVLVCVC